MTTPRRGYFEVQKFAEHMLTQLERNEAKGPWKKNDWEEQASQLVYHTAKLVIAMRKRDERAIAEYAADVGNEAMIVADMADILHRPAPAGVVLINEVIDGRVPPEWEKELPEPGESDADPILKDQIHEAVIAFQVSLAEIVGKDRPEFVGSKRDFQRVKKDKPVSDEGPDPKTGITF